MQPEIHKLLLDIQFALLEIQEFTAGMNLFSYQADSSEKYPSVLRQADDFGFYLGRAVR